jgi:molecular chaperone DnaK
MTTHHREPGMVRLGVDFGVTMTVIAVSDPTSGYSTAAFPGLSREFPAGSGQTPVHGIPALIQYEDGKSVRFGEEVARAGAGDSPATARWIRRYLFDKSPVQIMAGNSRLVRYEEAATEYLGVILSHVMQKYPGAELVFTLPPGAPENYPEFMNRIGRAAGNSGPSWVHEYRAVAAGYGYIPASGEPFLIIDFSETGMEAAIVVADDQRTSNGGIRVLTRGTGSAGCRAIDTWIVQDMLAQFRLLESDPRAARLSPRLLYEAGRVRELLSHSEEQPVCITDRISGKTFAATYTITDLTRILIEHAVIPALLECIDRALSGMRLRGADAGIRHVFLIGPGCAIPAVQAAICSRFPPDTVHADHPLDAIARGAAFSEAPAKTPDIISHSYAIRYWDAAVKEHHYRFLVHQGARFPSAGQVARIVISAAYDGQTHLGIPLYEIGVSPVGHAPEIELVSDTGGGVRLAGPAQDAVAKEKIAHVNERTPTLLAANPPARKGESRFECTFTIDADRNLCLSARDLLTGALVKLNTPVYRMK